MTFEPGARVRTSWRDDTLPREARAKAATVIERHAFLSTLTGRDLYVIEVDGRKGERYGAFADRLRTA